MVEALIFTLGGGGLNKELLTAMMKIVKIIDIIKYLKYT